MSFRGEMEDFMKAYETGQRLQLNQVKLQAGRQALERPPGYDPNVMPPSSFPQAPGSTVGTTPAPQTPDPKSGTGTDANGFGQRAYKFYRSKGLSHAHAAGIVGNLMVESAGGDPKVLMGTRTGDNGASYYAGQWNQGRLDNLLSYAKQVHPNSPQPTEQDQLQFVLEESNPQSPFYDEQAGKAFQLGQAAKTPAEATDAYMTYYERPRDRSSFARRTEYASGFADDGGPYTSGTGDVTSGGSQPDQPDPNDTQPAADESGGDQQQPDLNPQIDLPYIAPQPEIKPVFVSNEEPPGLYAQGGAIPDDTQNFAEGGVPFYDNPNNPSGNADPYNPYRAYTQKVPPTSATPGTATVPRRIQFPTSGTGMGAGQDWRNWGGGSPAQLALRKGIADRAAAKPAPVAAPAVPAAAAPKPKAKYPAQMIYAPGGGGSGQQQFFQIPTSRGPNRNWARGGRVSNEDIARRQAASSNLPDRDRTMRELWRQESQGVRSQHSADGGESGRDRAARRLSAMEGRPSSTAYLPSDGRGNGTNRFPPRPRHAGGGGGGGDKKEGTGYPEEINTAAGTPLYGYESHPAEDRATRFRESELVPGPSSVRVGRDGKSGDGGGGDSGPTIDVPWFPNARPHESKAGAAPAKKVPWFPDFGSQEDDNVPVSKTPMMARGGAIPSDDRFTGVRNVGRSAEQGATYRARRKKTGAGVPQTKSGTKKRPKSTTKAASRNQRKRKAATPKPRPDTLPDTAPVPTPRPRTGEGAGGYDPRGTPDPLKPGVGNDPRGTPDPYVPPPVGPGGTPTGTYRNTTLGGTPTRGYEPPPTPVAAGTPTRGYEPPPRPVPAGTPTGGYEPYGPPGGTPTAGYEPSGPPGGTPTYGYEPEELRKPQPYVPGGGGTTRRTEPLYAHQELMADRYQQESAAARHRQHLRDIGGRVAPHTADVRSTTPATQETLDEILARVNPPPPGVTGADSGFDPALGYARGGAIPDYPKPLAEEASPASSAYPAGEQNTPSVASQPQQEDFSQQNEVNWNEARDRASPAVQIGLDGLKNLFGLGGQQGAIPTEQDAAARHDGMQRLARHEGAATQQELQAIDGSTGIDQIRTDEGTKQLIRLDQTVNWYLQHGDKDKAEAVAASLLLYGAGQVQRAGVLAMTAFQQYQQSGDPKDLHNASLAVQRATQLIPDGLNMKIDVDPKTHQIVATTVDADGKSQQEVIDPQMIPGLLKQAMDGSAYWGAVYQVGQPRMAEQRLQNEASAGKKDSEHDWQLQFDEYKDRREHQQQLDTEDRAGERKLFERQLDDEAGRSADERQQKQDVQFYNDWGKSLKEATTDADKQALVGQGLQYRWDQTKPRQQPLLDEDITRTTMAEDSKVGEEDRGFATSLARSLGERNPEYDAVGVSKAAEALITAPDLRPTKDGHVYVDGFSLVFNPLLLPQLMSLRKKYIQPAQPAP